MQLEPPRMEDHWMQSIADGGKSFVEKVYKALGVKGKHRNIIEDGSSFYIKRAIVLTTPILLSKWTF
jgi:hypothetical protein